MPKTYDPRIPTGKDWVRFLIGDRTVATAYFEDEELEALLQEEPNKYLAAARAAEILLGKHGDAIMKQVGDLRIQWNDSPQSAYRNYIKVLRERGARDTLSPHSRSFRVLSGCSRF